jgi:Flp pilus assembly protein TadB
MNLSQEKEALHSVDTNAPGPRLAALIIELRSLGGDWTRKEIVQFILLGLAYGVILAFLADTLRQVTASALLSLGIGLILSLLQIQWQRWQRRQRLVTQIIFELAAQQNSIRNEFLGKVHRP